MRLKIIIIILFLPLVLAHAEKLPSQIIQSAVQTWVREVTADARPEAVVEELTPYVVDGDTAVYIAYLNDEGYCVTGVYEEMLPVYFYSPHGDFDYDDVRMSQALITIRESYHNFMDKLLLGGTEGEKAWEVAEERRAYWNDLAVGRIFWQLGTTSIMDGPDSMRVPNFPLWGGDQHWPMNALTPYIVTWAGPCTLRTVDGCTAHSMAMILRTWEWPVIGQGRDSTDYDVRTGYFWENTPLNFYPFVAGFDSMHCVWRNRIRWRTGVDGGELGIAGTWDHTLINWAKFHVEPSLDSIHKAEYDTALEILWRRLTPVPERIRADFSTTVYRYDLMPLVRDSIDTPEEINAVSTLTSSCGIASHMMYGVLESAAWCIPETYIEHFRFDEDAIGNTFIHCPEPDTCSGMKTIVDEIQWRRVVNYHYGAPISHAWCIYGYNRTFLPDSMQVLADNYIWMTFVTDIVEHPMVYRLAPKDAVKFVGGTRAGDGSPASPYSSFETAIADTASLLDDVTLIFKAGSDNVIAADSVVVSKPMILKGYYSTIR
ncbi:C10 family peptidase [bacterium]|nr:C10 family peptidase [bacterium]